MNHHVLLASASGHREHAREAASVSQWMNERLGHTGDIP